MPLRTELYTLYRDPDAVDKFLANSRQIQPVTYMRQCRDNRAFPDSQRKKVSGDTVVMSLPCSNETDARSRQVLPLMEGMKLDALGTVQNSLGDLWYRVEYEGETGYVYEGHLKDLGLFDKFWDALLN